MMELTSLYALTVQGQPRKDFHKAGVVDVSGYLTEAGIDLFLNFLFEKHSAEFKTKCVDPILQAVFKGDDKVIGKC